MNDIDHQRSVYPILRTVLLALALLLSGCSVKFIYNQLDWVIPWYLDDYITFNSAQELLLDKQLDELLAWHRTDQLPQYASFLEQLAIDSQNGLDKVSVDTLYQQVQFFANQLLDAATPAIVALLTDIDQRQYDELFENLEQKNAEYREKYIELSETKQRRKRASQIRKFVQRWTGLLDDPQIALIKKWSTEYQLMGEEFLQSRLLWQKKLRTILQQQSSNFAMQQALTRLLNNHQFGHSETYKQKAGVNRQLLQQLFLSLDQSLSQQQRLKMKKELNNYAQDFRQLTLR